MEFRQTYYSFTRDVFYNILIDVGVCMKLFSVIKMCEPETYTRIRVGNSLSDMCSVRNGLKEVVGLSPLFSTFDLEYAIRLACNCMLNISWVMLMMLIYW
jgi:hypothetical protein